MKNFYEATVIRPKLKLKMVLDLEAVGSCPCQILINNQSEFQGNLVGKNTFVKHLNLSDNVNIQIIVNRQHPQAIQITSLKIDDHEIIPLYLNQSDPPTNYIDFTGIWTLKITNFYSWLHEINGQGWII